MTDKTFGRKVPVALRKVWEREDAGFTPWLAKEGLPVLSETLGIPLVEAKQEKRVGPYKADIVCRDAETGSVVLIENQFGKTDHEHLGKLLTYSSNLEATTMVWVAESFSVEHRAALEWLDRETGEHLHFFGVEVETFKVEDSPVAVEFHIVVGPDGPSRAVVSKRFKVSAPKPDSETAARHRAYWTALRAVLMEAGGPLPGTNEPQGTNVMMYSISGAPGGIDLQAHRRPNGTITASLYLYKDSPSLRFQSLEKEKDAIERDFGDQLLWRTAGTTYHIEASLGALDIDDEQDWPRQHDWLAAKLNRLHEVFADRVKAFKAEDWQMEFDSEAEG